jgi:hypothetical protein
MPVMDIWPTAKESSTLMRQVHIYMENKLPPFELVLRHKHQGEPFVQVITTQERFLP